MITQLKSPSAPDSYLNLVKAFPLIHIRDDAHLEAASERIRELLTTPLDEGGEEYLDALSDLVMVYEQKHHPMRKLSGREFLRALVDAKSVSQAELARQTHISTSTISAILKGTRDMTIDHMQAFATYFRVEPGVFLRR